MPLVDPITTVHEALDAQAVSIWEFASSVVIKPTPSDPNTWDWTPAIQSAASSQYGTVEFQDGVYLISASITMPANKRFLLSKGAIIRRKQGSGAFNMLVATSVASTMIIGGTIDGNRAADSLSPTNPAQRFSGIHFTGCSFPEIRGVKVIGTVNNETNGGIYVDGCTDPVVDSCIATDNDRTGIVLFNNTRGRFARNTGYSNIGSGITSSTNVDCEYFENVCYSNGSGGTYTGLNASGLRSRVIGNLSYSNTGSGISAGESTHEADDSEIIGNICYSNGLDGVTIQTSVGVKIIGNTLSLNTRDGVRALTGSNKTKVVGNDVRSNTQRGIYITVGSGNVVADNESSFNGIYGIHLETPVLDSLVSGNFTEGNGSAAGANASGIVVSGSNHVIGGNRSRDNGSGTQLFGLWMSGATACQVHDNILSGNVTQGIRETSSPTYASRANKIGTDIPTGQFTATAASTATVVSNNNARVVNRIKVYPLNSAAAARPGFVSSISVGVSFTVTFSGNSAGTEIYGYEID
ncbi:hypothetical protein D3C76_520970 [compost metagenome]